MFQNHRERQVSDVANDEAVRDTMYAKHILAFPEMQVDGKTE